MSGLPKFEAAAVIEAPIEQVAGLILAVRPGPIGPENAWLLQDGSDAATLVSGGPDVFRAASGGFTLTVEVDRARRAIAFQGGWWYRGEYALVPDPDGALLTYRVTNVASLGTRWMVPLANRFFAGFDRQQDEQFRSVCGRIGERLGCATRTQHRA